MSNKMSMQGEKNAAEQLAANGEEVVLETLSDLMTNWTTHNNPRYFGALSQYYEAYMNGGEFLYAIYSAIENDCINSENIPAQRLFRNAAFRLLLAPNIDFGRNSLFSNLVRFGELTATLDFLYTCTTLVSADRLVSERAFEANGEHPFALVVHAVDRVNYIGRDANLFYSSCIANAIELPAIAPLLLRRIAESTFSDRSSQLIRLNKVLDLFVNIDGYEIDRINKRRAYIENEFTGVVKYRYPLSEDEISRLASSDANWLLKSYYSRIEGEEGQSNVATTSTSNRSFAIDESPETQYPVEDQQAKY